MNLKLINIFLAFIFIILPCLAQISFAAPSVSGVIGTLKNNVSVTITGNVNLSNTSQTIIFPPLLAGDVNSDNVINSLDYSVMNTKWFMQDATSDLNKDGIVNAIDFSLLNKNWQKRGE